MADEEYDIRRYPNRGVRVDPLPPHMHREFIRFCRQIDTLFQSHYSTYALAEREGIDPAFFAHVAIYWRAARKALKHIEYLGTRHGSPRRR